MDETTNPNINQEERYTFLYPNGVPTATLLFDKVTGELMLLKGSIIKGQVTTQFEKLFGGILNTKRKEFIVDYCDRCPDSDDYITIEHVKVSDLQQAETYVIGNNDTQGKCWTEIKKIVTSPIENKIKLEYNIQTEEKIEKVAEDEVEPSFDKSERTIYHLVSKSYNCMMYLVDEKDEQKGCILLKDSILALNTMSSLQKAYIPLRNLILSTICVKEEKGYRLTSDYTFKNINFAARVCSGYSINARTAWKDQNGKTIKEIFENKNNLYN